MTELSSKTRKGGKKEKKKKRWKRGKRKWYTELDTVTTGGPRYGKHVKPSGVLDPQLYNFQRKKTWITFIFPRAPLSSSKIGMLLRLPALGMTST